MTDHSQDVTNVDLETENGALRSRISVLEEALKGLPDIERGLGQRPILHDGNCGLGAGLRGGSDNYGPGPSVPPTPVAIRQCTCFTLAPWRALEALRTARTALEVADHG